MFLSDYLYAINYLAAVLGSDMSMCFENIGGGVMGDRIVFSFGEAKYVVYRNGAVRKTYSDTWRNPEHAETIKEGSGEEVW